MSTGQTVTFEAEWDAGDLGCGELVIELRFRLAELPPGSTIRVRATDTGAAEDLPAWCRMTGHRLVHQDASAHHFFIARRPEQN
jgi:tRNA 2-thiouridine synthesizing protein A